VYGSGGIALPVDERSQVRSLAELNCLINFQQDRGKIAASRGVGVL
jgi:hypothetical protein